MSVKMTLIKTIKHWVIVKPIDFLFVTDLNQHCAYCIIAYAVLMTGIISFLFGLGFGLDG